MSPGSSSIIAQCQHDLPDAGEVELLECVAAAIQKNQQSHAEDVLDFLFVLSGAMIFFMQAGFAVLCAGAVRIKNVQNTMLKNLLDACGAAVAFFLIGKHIYATGSSRRRKKLTLRRAFFFQFVSF